MKVTILPEHLRGADFASPTDCPLARAILPMLKEKYPDAWVGLSDVYDKFGYGIAIFSIPVSWNSQSVNTMIARANEGSEATYEIELEPVKSLLGRVNGE